MPKCLRRGACWFPHTMHSAISDRPISLKFVESREQPPSSTRCRELNALASFIAERKLNTVFIETSVPDRGVHSLIDGRRASGQNVGIAGPLYADGLGQPGTATGSYVGMIRYNVDKIVEALK